MIKITSTEHIKTKGEFKLDKLWVVNLVYNHLPSSTSKKTIEINVVPYDELEDGTLLFDKENPFKLHIPDAKAHFIDNPTSAFAAGYVGVENGIIEEMLTTHGISCEYEASL